MEFHPNSLLLDVSLSELEAAVYSSTPHANLARMFLIVIQQQKIPKYTLPTKLKQMLNINEA